MAQNHRVASLRSLLARYPRLDSRAVEAVASREGLGGGIGDSGHAFGPFQLNNAGGVITGRFAGQSPEQINAWAWSPEGIQFALDRINKVAGGLRGRAAIEAIVRQFERPANPGGEIAGAVGAYGAVPAADSRSGPQGLAGALGGMPTIDPGARRRALLSLASSFDEPGIPDVSPLLRALQGARAPVSEIPAAPLGEAPPVTTLPARAGAGPFVSPLSGKLIGKPYQGTHARDFNIRGGSNNWESENAVDIAAPVGTPIRAVSDGVIGEQFGSLGEGGRFAGLRLHLRTPGDEFYYAHLSRYAPGIKPGVRVRKGQIIGYSGEANGVGHLHFGEENANPLRLI